MADYKFALITPAKNEEDNVAHVVDAISKQTIKPDLWVFVNDSSTDNTVKIFKEEISKHGLEDVIHIPITTHHDKEANEYALGSKYSKVILFGINEVLAYEKSNDIRYDYIGVLDCDVLPESSYYEKLLNRMHADRSIGIASGGTQFEYNSQDELVTTTVNYKNHTPGGLRVWRRECLDDTGYFPSISQDAVSAARALMKGWKVISYKDISVKMRERGANFGYDYYGESAYKRHVPYWYLLLKVMKLTASTEFKKAYLYHKGYMSAKKRNDERITDELAIRYFKSQPYQRLTGLLKKEDKSVNH